ncbi:hypothetical protein LQE85_08680 [Stenotrophomonas rhizophila]|uniref:hypothetical protein n=1 Tax=Stenotrophomonas rhizophila TaxID=216778 RepID=UPI00201CF2AF|nr:hypothetical protein [Stenotrophomonas rhizophila]UQY89256.1 hypothetical protein LQE85_08680 [Stenotrophomonas rhizophila]
MDKRPADRDKVVLTALGTGFGLLAGWGLFYRWGSGPAFEPVNLSDWVQAAGTLLGIGIAVYVPWRQRQYQIDEERRRETELREIMHTALYQPVEGYRADCAYLQRDLRATRQRRTQMPKFLFDRPPEFDQFREKLHLLGELGDRINKLIAHQDVVRVHFKEFLLFEDHVPASFIPMLAERLEQGIAKAEGIGDALKLLANERVTW